MRDFQQDIGVTHSEEADPIPSRATHTQPTQTQTQHCCAIFQHSRTP